MKEKETVELISGKLNRRGYSKIIISAYLGRKIGKDWIEKYGRPKPLFQPEIDIILIGEDKYPSPELKNHSDDTTEKLVPVRAIEVKRFRSKRKYSFYKGLDQAIAYLRFGFDNVALWQIFDEELFKGNQEYAFRTWQFIRELKLPLEYTAIILDDDNLYPVNTLFFEGRSTQLRCNELGGKDFYMKWPSERKNPYLNTNEGIKFRTLIDKWIINEII